MEDTRTGEESGKDDISHSAVILQKIWQFKMKKIIFAVLLAALAACSPKIVYLPGENHTVVEYRDSVVVRTDTLKIPVPAETVKEVADRLGVLEMETSVAEARAWVDPDTETLRGEMKNKKTDLKKEVMYKDRYITKDSLVYVKEPYPVEVEKPVRYIPWVVKVLAWIGGISLIVSIIYILRKFHIL